MLDRPPSCIFVLDQPRFIVHVSCAGQTGHVIANVFDMIGVSSIEQLEEAARLIDVQV